MIKVIASDLDGTLFGSDSKIAPETLAAVKRACKAGIRTGPVSSPPEEITAA